MIFCTLCNFLKPLATINLLKSFTFFGNFCKVVKIFHFSSEISFGQLLQTFGKFLSGQTNGEHNDAYSMFIVQSLAIDRQRRNAQAPGAPGAPAGGPGAPGAPGAPGGPGSNFPNNQGM